MMWSFSILNDKIILMIGHVKKNVYDFRSVIKVGRCSVL